MGSVLDRGEVEQLAGFFKLVLVSTGLCVLYSCPPGGLCSDNDNDNAGTVSVVEREQG